MRLRYVRAGAVEREQLNWFGWASAVFVVAGSVEIILGVARNLTSHELGRTTTSRLEAVSTGDAGQPEERLSRDVNGAGRSSRSPG